MVSTNNVTANDELGMKRSIVSTTDEPVSDELGAFLSTKPVLVSENKMMTHCGTKRSIISPTNETVNDVFETSTRQKNSKIIASSAMTQVVPQDWDEEGKYHPALVYIWKSWLNFIPVFDGKQTVDGPTLRLVPLSLPWLDQWNLDDEGIPTFLMHYMPIELSNLLSDDLHPATAT
jgi:hypothetical protein